MLASDMLQYAFPGLDTQFIVFSGEDECATESIEEASAFVTGRAEAGVRLHLPDKTIAGFAAPGLSPDEATFVISRGEATIPVVMLADPAQDDAFPEHIICDIPVSGKDGWSMLVTSDTFFSLAEAQERALKVVPSAAENTSEAEGDGRSASEDVTDAASPGGVHAVEDARFKDAHLLGTETEASNAVMARETTLMGGRLYGARDHRNTQDGKWVPVSDTWGALISGTFTKHEVSKRKEGDAVVLGESVGGARTARAMKTMHAIGLDIDSGARLADVLKTLVDLGLFAIVYTTHSHGKTSLELNSDDVLRKLKLTVAPTLEQVKDYLREHAKDRYEPTFIDAVTIKDPAMQTKDGVKIVLTTPPLDKFRLIFPLAEPIDITSLDPNQAKALSIWEDKVTGLAANVLKIEFDVACTDPSRLFYLPRHPEGAEFYSAVVQGEPLDFDGIEPMSKAFYAKNRGVALNPLAQAGLGENEGGVVPEVLTPSGKSLREWHQLVGKDYGMATMLDAEISDRVRDSGGQRSGSINVECPFEHEHSKEGGTGLWSCDASESASGYWVMKCPHNACQHRHKLEFLGEMLALGWFDEEVLHDQTYLPDLDDATMAALAAWAAGPLTRDTWHDDAAAAATVRNAGIGRDSSNADVEALLERAVKGGVDDTGIARLWEEAKKAGLLMGRHPWNKLVKAAKAREHAAEEARQREADGDVQKINVAKADFYDMADAVRERIATKNEAEPYFFEHLDRPAVIRRDAEGRARIHHHNKDGVTSEINKLKMFQKPLGDEGFRGVSVPLDVVIDICGGDLGSFSLPLRGVVRSPFFSPSGELIDKAGYHRESKVFYEPPTGFEVPPVSKRPSAAEVNEAKRLLVEEVFADFPLGGLTQPEIVERSLRGDGVPAVTNLIGLAVLPFMRDMIAGPTPGHLVTKPAPGTGASLMMDAFSTIANGQPSAAQPMPSRPEEMTKTLTSVIADGLNIAFFDNITHSVDSGDLASALTATTYGARILGRSEIVQAEVRCVWVFTGNNTKLSAELVRRLVMIDLDAHLANPELRQGFRHTDLMGWVRANRGRLVWACLTLIQNWVAGGMVPDSENVMASYVDWSRKIGGVLKAAGLGGFRGNSEEMREMATDDREDGVRMLMKALSAYPDGTVFRPSSTQGAVVGLMDVLNGEGESGEAIYIDGWGYSSGEDGYLNANRIGRNFKTIAKKPHRVSIAEGDWELKFEALKDTRNGTMTYRMSKREVGEVVALRSDAA